MKVKVGLLMMLVVGIIIPTLAYGQGPAPSHIVYGSIVRWEGDTIPSGCLHFWAYRVGYPSDTLFDTSLGCGYSSGRWYIQVSSFSGGWNVGDTLRVIFADSCILERAGVNIVLNSEPSQEYGDTVRLYPIAGVRPVLANGSVTPERGYVRTGFVYHILYTHPGRVPPSSVVVNVDGVNYTLIPDPDSLFLDYELGCWFRTASPISGLVRGASHTFRFSATDADGREATGDIFVHYGPEVLNSRPSIVNITIEPSTAKEGDTIRVSVSTSDPDMDPVSVSYEWYNQRGQIPEASSQFLTSDYFSKHDTVYCRVVVSDPYETGDTGYSGSVPVLNTPPSAPGGTITPMPPLDNDVLGVSFDSYGADIDGDSITILYYWYVNGVLVSNDPTIPASEFGVGDTVRCVLQGTDNDGGFSPQVTLFAVVRQPYLENPAFSPNTGNARTLFAFEVTYYNPRNIPPEVVEVLINGAAYTLSPLDEGDDNYIDGARYGTEVNLARGQYNIEFRAVDINGNVARGTQTLQGPVVVNSAPEIANAELVPATGEAFAVGVPIIVRVGSVFDIDGDPVMLLYKWYKNGIRLAVGSDRLDPFYFAAGDTIWCEVYPYDGALWGEYITTPSVVIGNTPPTAPRATIQPENPTTLDDLELVITSPSTDVDGDPISYSYHWYLNGEYVDAIDGPVVSAEYTSRGEVWGCYLIYTDQTYVDSVYVETVILNHLPILTELPPSIAIEGIPYMVGITARDPDGDDFWANLVEGPDGMIADGLVLSWANPVFNSRGYRVRFTLSDPEGTTEAHEYLLNVLQRTDASVAPSELVARSGYFNLVPLSWNPPAILREAPYIELGLRGYIVERGTSYENFEQIGFVTDTRYIDRGVTSGVTYFYRVRAQYADFVSEYSNVATAIPGGEPNYLYSSFGYVLPRIDGVIERNEWNSASVYNFGPYTLYLMNTNEALFIAIVNGADDNLAPGDEVLISFDDNHTGSWPSREPSGEGEYRLTYTTSGANFTYQGIWYSEGVYRADAVPVVSGEGGIGFGNGGVVYEISLRLDENPELLDALQNHPGGELGVRFAVNNSSTPGWEFVLPTGSDMDNPLTFGTLLLSTGGYPELVISPEEFTVTLNINTTSCFPLYIRNVGSSPLYFNITEDYVPFAGRVRVNPERVRVLVLTDVVEPSMEWVLNYLGFQGDIVNGVATFLAALRSESYDILVVNLRGEIALDPVLLAAVDSFVADGGRAVISTADIDDNASAPLWRTLGVAYGADLGARASAVSFSEPAHPIFNTPFVVMPIMRLPDSRTDYGDGLRTTSALALAKFDVLAEPENVAIAISENARAIVNSFVLSGTIDRNGDGINDLAQLLVNELRYISPNAGVPWVSVEPASGSVPVYGSIPVDICFNTEGLLPNMTYRAYLTVFTNSNDARYINIPVVLNTRLPETHTLSFTFPENLEARVGDVVEVPVYINDCTGWNITSMDVKLLIEGEGVIFEGVRLNRNGGPASDWSTPTILEHTRNALRFRTSGTTPLAGEGILAYVRLSVPVGAHVGDVANLTLEPFPILNPEALVDNYHLGSARITVIPRQRQWVLTLIATVDEAVETLYVGIDPYATSQFDPGFDVPLALSDTLGIYIVSLDTAYPHLSTDIRCECDDAGNGITWTINTGARSGKLEWSFTDNDTIVGIGSLYLNSRLDMKENFRYFFTAGELVTITYRRDGKIPFWYHVYPGFNMLSVPLRLSSTSLDFVFPDTIGITQRAYRYDTRAGRWVPVNTIEPGLGYAVLFSAEKEFVHWGYPIRYFEIPLNQGWNLVGSVYNEVPADRIVTEPSSILIPGIHWYDPVTRRYVQQSAIEPGRGCFVASLRDGVLKLGSGGRYGKAYYTTGAIWMATVEALTEEGAKSFVIGEANQSFYLPELPVLPGFDVPVRLMSQAGALYMSLEPEASEWNFVSFTKSSFELSAQTPVELEVEVNGRTYELGANPITIPGGCSFSILKKASRITKFEISAPYPNPFNLETHISLSLPEQVDVRLEVVNVMGQRVKSVDYGKIAGRKDLVWDGTNNSGLPVSSGLYFLRVQAGDNMKTLPTLLIK